MVRRRRCKRAAQPRRNESTVAERGESSAYARTSRERRSPSSACSGGLASLRRLGWSQSGLIGTGIEPFRQSAPTTGDDDKHRSLGSAEADPAGSRARTPAPFALKQLLGRDFRRSATGGPPVFENDLRRGYGFDCVIASLRAEHGGKLVVRQGRHPLDQHRQVNRRHQRGASWLTSDCADGVQFTNRTSSV